VNHTWIYTTLSVTIISLVSLTGVLVITFTKKLSKSRLLNMVGLSAGGMLGGAFFHLLPESLSNQNITTVSTVALTGIFTSYCIEMLLNWRHCHIPTSDDHPHTFVYMNLIGDGVHNFIDGLVIAGAFQVDNNLGLVTTLAIILHEIPQEIGDFGVLLYGGFETRRAIMYNLLTGVTAIIGAFLALILGSRLTVLSDSLIPFAFGNFIYIAGSDLVPELRDEKDFLKSVVQLSYMVSGVVLLYLLRFIE
jgi:zinc and cadmium transporter